MPPFFPVVNPYSNSLLMQDPWPPLFDALCLELGRIRQGTAPGSEQTEVCFKSCLHHWGLVKESVSRAGFENDASEVHFFKQVKPLFTGLLEFYHYVYFDQLFRPPGGPADIFAFERNERLKIGRFRQAYAPFIAYYEAGATDKDADYFLRRNLPGEQPPYARSYDADPEFRTAADWLVTLYIGYTRYEAYLGEEKRKMKR
jgi:hypothetical protein